MSLQLGSAAPTSVMLGSAAAVALYVGAVKVWPADTGGGAAYPAAVAALSPILYLRLGDTAGTTAADSSTNGWNGTYSGGYTLGVATTAGDGDTAVSFTAAGSGQAAVPHNTALNLDTGAGKAWSLSFVLRPDVSTSGTYPGVIGKGGGGASGAWEIFRDGGTGALGFKKQGTQVTTSTGAVTQATWSHWVVTYDGANIYWYKDGALNTTSPFATALTSTNTGALTLNKGDSYGDNTLDEVVIFPSTLTAADVSNLYTAYTTPGGGAGTPPVASFTQSATSGVEPLTVTFTDTSTNTPTSWAWDFGDGGTSSQQNPSHTFSGAGTYTVKLTAGNAAGSGAATGTVTVSASAGAAQPYGATPASLATWSLAFEDHFDGTSVDTTKWHVVDGEHDQNGVNNIAANITVANSEAHLQLSDVSTGSQMFTQQVDGDGNVNGYTIKVGGYTEARVWFVATTEMVNWPAWWTVGAAWSTNGECDIAEVMSGGLSVNYHHGTGGTAGDIADNGPIEPYGTWGNGWHVYGVYRNPAGYYDVYWDGVLQRHIAVQDAGGAHSLVLNMGVHSSRTKVYGDAGAMRVDYVRAWEPA